MDEGRTSEKRLCRLCGKQRDEKDFTEITLTVMGNRAIRYRGYKLCDVVIHNASILTREMILQEAKKMSAGEL